MKWTRLALRGTAGGAVLVSAVAAIVAACDGNESPATPPGALIDGSRPANTQAPSPPPPEVDAMSVDAAYFDGRPSDARGDVVLGQCNDFPALLCNFDGICPGFAGVSGGSFQLDSGPDGSKSFAATVRVGGPFDGGGGGGFFAMPYREITDPNAIPPSVDHCAVTCEANVRIVDGVGEPVGIVHGDDVSFDLQVADGGYFHSTPISQPVLHTIRPSNEWLHVKVHQIPPAAGSALWTSELTITDRGAADAGSSTTTRQTQKRGSSVRFGVIGKGPIAVPTTVFVDDVTCKLSDQ